MAAIDFNFEFQAPHYVDFTALKDDDPDDSWFENYEDIDSNAEEAQQVAGEGVESPRQPPTSPRVKALTKAMTPKLHTAARSVLKGPASAIKAPARVQPARLSKGNALSKLETHKPLKPDPVAPKLTVPKDVVLHSQQRAQMRQVATVQPVPSTPQKSVDKDIVKPVKAPQPTKPKPTMPQPFSFQTDARRALKRLAKPDDVDITEQRGLTSPVSNKMKRMRPMAIVHSIPKLTVPHSPHLATAKRSQFHQLAHPEEKQKAAEPKETPVQKEPPKPVIKRGPTVPAPFRLASDARAQFHQAQKDLVQPPTIRPPVNAEEPTPKPKRIQQLHQAPKLTVPVSPKLSTRTRAKVRSQIEAVIQEEKARVVAQPHPEPAKAHSTAPRPLTIPKPFNLSVTQHHRGLRKSPDKAALTKPSEVTTKVSRVSIGEFKSARKDVVRRGPTIPIPFVLESDKRAAAAAQLRRMADVASVTEQPSTASALKRARTDDDQLSLEEPATKKFKTPGGFKARAVPSSLYTPALTVKATKRQLDFEKNAAIKMANPQVPSSERKPVAAKSRLGKQERRKTTAASGRLKL